MSNFAFLRAEWPDLFQEALRAERNTIADPRASCFYARRSLELAVTWLYEADGSLRQPYKNDLSALIFEPTMRSLVGPGLHAKMDIIRKRGNAAVHKDAPITPNDALPVVRELFHVLYWLARHCARNPAAVPPSPHLQPGPDPPARPLLRPAADPGRTQGSLGETRRLVEYYVDFDHWHRLTPEAIDEIGTHLSGLPTTVRDEDEAAKRFDLLVLRLQLGQLDAESGYDRLRTQVREIASALLEQTSIPVIREQQQLLDEVAGDEWWQDITLPMLELLRRRVRPLVKLIEKSKRTIVYTDFKDQLGELAEVELSGVVVGTDFERFRAKARVYLRAHEDHLALQKLRRNRQLSATDLAELERMLAESGAGGASEIDQARRSADGLGLFIRSLVGLDREAATAAFGDFLDGKTLNASQIDFVKLIIDHLTENGVMEASRLYESPFTEIAPHGPESLFPSADVDKLIAILRSVRATAAPSYEVA